MKKVNHRKMSYSKGSFRSNGSVRKVSSINVRKINEGIRWIYTSEERESEEMKTAYIRK